MLPWQPLVFRTKRLFSDSAATANICNVALMRHSELSEGIDVMDSNGNVVGSSKVAARHVSILPQIYEDDGGQRCVVFPLSSCVSGPICCYKRKIKSDLSKRVHNVLSLFPQAIMETAFTRVVLPMPIFVLPPIVMSYLERFIIWSMHFYDTMM